ncbi:MAG: GLPGLI family protein [Flavobacteriaceae bacterium]|nr:GLPGLI family protein [Flavobacteriaceae bacterium]
MRNFIFILISLTVYKGYSQIVSGKVIYNASMARFHHAAPDHIKSNPMSKFTFQKEERLAKSIESELIFNRVFSQFKIKKSLSKPKDRMTHYLVSSLISKGVYYTNLNEAHTLLKLEQGGESMKISHNLKNTKWHLTQEKKIIGDFECLKAYCFIQLPNKKHKVYAWYAPSIPFSFGPKNYSGYLPGLILELDTPSIKLTAKVVELYKQEKKIKAINDEGAISKEEYDKISKLAYEGIRGN